MSLLNCFLLLGLFGAGCRPKTPELQSAPAKKQAEAQPGAQPIQGEPAPASSTPGSTPPAPMNKTEAPPALSRQLAFEPQSCLKNPTTQACYTIDPSLMELSGIAASRVNKDLVWSHNDEGEPVVFALNLKGEIVARISLPGATNLDWEDNAVGPGPDAAQSYLYQGDIGDKGKAAGQVFIYRFLEPKVDPAQRNQTGTASQVVKITLQYPETTVLDFETLMVDPLSGDLFLVQKGGTKVFKALKADLNKATAAAPVAMQLVRSTGAWSPDPSSGTISPQGDEILLRNETTAWFFKRAPGLKVEDALGQPPALTLTLGKEFNGEAITYDAQGLDFMTLSENTSKDAEAPSPPQPISLYKRK